MQPWAKQTCSMRMHALWLARKHAFVSNGK